MSICADTRVIWRPSLAVVLVGSGTERELESRWNLSNPILGSAKLVRRETKLLPGRNSSVCKWGTFTASATDIIFEHLLYIYIFNLQMRSLFLLWPCWGTWGTWSLWASVRNITLRSLIDCPRRWAWLLLVCECVYSRWPFHLRV